MYKFNLPLILECLESRIVLSATIGSPAPSVGDAGAGAVASDTTVAAVYISSTTWTTAYLNSLASSGLGSATLGYEIPTGSAAQFSSLGWANLNQISLTFSQDVVISQDAFHLSGDIVPSHAISNFSYNSATHTATWTMVNALCADNLQLNLSAASVVDANGNAFDGEWTDGVSTASGNGSPGGDFSFHLNILPGDINHDGQVDLTDLTSLSANWQQFVPPSSSSDLNGDGFIDLTDLTILADNWQSSITIPAAPTNLVFSNVATTSLTLNWNDNSNEESGFSIYRSTDNINFARIGTVAANITSFSDSGLAAGTLYFYQVAANFNDNAGAATSMTASATTLPAILNPISISTENMTSFTELDINGTAVNDSIWVTQSNNVLTIIGNGQTITIADTFGDIVIHGYNGNDNITVASSVNIATLIYGGDGNDTIINNTTGKATIVTIGNGTNTVTGNGINTSFWVNPNDVVNASATETANSAVNRVANWYQPYMGMVPRGLYGQNLLDPTDSGYEYRLTANSFWGTGPTMNDINQGQLSDCYYLAPLASLANNETVKFMSTGVDLGDATYAVRFNRYGVTTFVRVDGDLSYNGYAFAGVSGNIWGDIYEKAYAFFRTGACTYSSLDLGFQYSAFSDLGFSNINIVASSTDSTILSVITNALASNHAIAADTQFTIQGGAPLIDSHAYSIIGAWRDASGTLQIELRNPWGIDGAGNDGNPGDGLVTINYAAFAANFILLTYTTS